MEYVLPVLIAFITAVIGPVIVEWAKSLFAKKRIDPLEEALEINAEIDHQLELIQEELKCDRIWVSQFHNGGHFYPTGKSIQKFSIFYEHVSPGTPTIKEIFSNIPASLFTKPLSKLYTDGEIIIPTYESSNVDTFGLENFNGAHDKKSSYIFALSNLDDQFLGTLGIEFCKEETHLNEEELMYIRSKVAAIGTVLNTYLHNIHKK